MLEEGLKYGGERSRATGVDVKDNHYCWRMSQPGATWILNWMTDGDKKSLYWSLPVQQCSDVWALSRLEPSFLWNNQFDLICHEIHSANVWRQFVFDQITQENIFDWKFGFLWKLFSISPFKLCFSDIPIFAGKHVF